MSSLESSIEILYRLQCVQCCLGSSVLVASTIADMDLDYDDLSEVEQALIGDDLL